MLTIESAEVKMEPLTFTPQLHVNFIVDLTVVAKEQLNNSQHNLAEIIGNEVIRQTSVWLSMTSNNEGHYEMA